MLVTRLFHVNFSASRLRKPESIELVVRRAETEVAVARTPEEHAVGDGSARQARTAAGEAPQDGTGGCVQGVHVALRVEGTAEHHPVGRRHRAGGATPIGGRGLPEQLTGHGIDAAPDPARAERRLRVAVGVGGVHALAINGRAPLQTAGSAARSGLGDPLHGACAGIKRPVLAALLSRTHQVSGLAITARFHSEQRRRLAEVIVGTCRIGAVAAVADERDAVDGPGVVRDGTSGPADCAGLQVEGKNRVEVVVRREAGRLAGGVAGVAGDAREHVIRYRVVVTRGDINLAALGVNGRAAAPHSAAAVPRRCRVGLPQDGPSVEVEGQHAAPE